MLQHVSKQLEGFPPEIQSMPKLPQQMLQHMDHEQLRPSRLKAPSYVTARTATEDSPLVGAGGRELHHHDVVAAGVALAVEVSALRVPTHNNGI